jgi:hypothetical protein
MNKIQYNLIMVHGFTFSLVVPLFHLEKHNEFIAVCMSKALPSLFRAAKYEIYAL